MMWQVSSLPKGIAQYHASRAVSLVGSSAYQIRHVLKATYMLSTCLNAARRSETKMQQDSKNQDQTWDRASSTAQHPAASMLSSATWNWQGLVIMIFYKNML